MTKYEIYKYYPLFLIILIIIINYLINKFLISEESKKRLVSDQFETIFLVSVISVTISFLICGILYLVIDYLF